MLISGDEVTETCIVTNTGGVVEPSLTEQVFEVIEVVQNSEGNANKLKPQSELIIIYKNVENPNHTPSVRPKRSNQYVETVVHDDGDDSDSTDSGSYEHLDTVFGTNVERLDLDKSSHWFLSHNLRGIKPTNDLAMEYRNFFKDPYVKAQLNSINTWPTSFEFSTILPTTLLDYLCAKGFDENYSFYMDNVISYVKHTIEQLRRISDGEFLTERAKEKWLQVEGRKKILNNNMILATSSSIPKMTADTKKWDDIIHSEVDIRSLCKMLEKKIVLKVPRSITGSYKMFQQDMTISCKVERPKVDNSPRLDVVVHIDHDKTGDATKDNSLIILKVKEDSELPEANGDSFSPVAVTNDETTAVSAREPLFIQALPYKDEQNTFRSFKSNVSIVELDDNGEPLDKSNNSETINDELSTGDEYFEMEKDSMTGSSNETDFAYQNMYVKGNGLMVTPYDLSFSMQKLSIQKPLTEESEETTSKKRSPTRVRIKSPYENKSYILEEKKRKKLLEMRQMREKKKLAVLENSKDKKQRPAKTPVMPHASNSVTRLSITNKAFYNSIYGQKVNSNRPLSKGRKELVLQIPNNSDEEDVDKNPLSSAEHDAIKYVNRSYYLDDAVTEVEMNENNVKEVLSASSAVSNFGSDGINELLNRLPTTPTVEAFTMSIRIDDKTKKRNEENIKKDVKHSEDTKKKADHASKRQNDKKKLPLECIKSIDKIYDLLKKISDSDNSVQPNKRDDSEANEPESSLVIATDSGTSMRHQLTSNPSSFSFANAKKQWEQPTPIVPKVIINAKTKIEPIKDRNITPVDNIKIMKEDPLKAISQLLHNIDSVQKKQERLKSVRKMEIGDNKGVRTVSFRKPDLREPKVSPERRIPTPKRPKPPSVLEQKIIEKNKKVDLLDEAKEARGEAVKGPKNFARMNALAQPRKSYIQAHNEEIKSRFGRSIVTERLQRLVDTPAPVAEKHANMPTMANRKPRRFESAPVKAASAAPLISPGRRPLASVPPAHRSPERRARAADDCSYVNKQKPAKKSRSRRSSPETVSPPPQPHNVRFARTPLLPDDEIVSERSPSPEDSTKLGNKLHQIISRTIMITSRPRPEIEVRKSISKDLFIIRESCSTTENFPVDVFADKTVLTAVEAISDEKNGAEDVKDMNKLNTKSILDLKTLESALYSQVYTGNFQKRLRLKNFTLTPKHSMQQIVVIQSGDSETVKLSPSKSDTACDLKSLNRLQVVPKIPMQVATVGYAFQKIKPNRSKITEVSNEPIGAPIKQTSQGSQANSESISDFSLKANAQSTPSNPKSNFTFNNNVDVETSKTKTAKEDAIVQVEENIEDKKEPIVKHDKVDCTSSLDILVKLLSEIQNITTNQTDLTMMTPYKDMEKEDKVVNSTRDIVSLTSLEQMRQLDSSPSLYSFYMSSDEERDIRRVKMLLPYNQDKGITVDLRRELVNNFTDIPSSLFPAMCRSTNISESLVGVLKKSSSHTAFNLTDESNNILKATKSASGFKDEDSIAESSVVIFRKEKKRKVDREIKFVQTESMPDKTVLKVIQERDLDVVHDFTPVMKAKRDILVTVYSLLVLTVFAALSFPGMVYQNS